MQLFFKMCCLKINLVPKLTTFQFPLKEFALLIFIFCILSNSSAFSRGKRIGTLPFEMVGTYMIVKVRFNDSKPLNLILDSGVRNIIVTELFPEDVISLSYINEINLQGLGSGKDLNAYASYNNTIQMGKLKLNNQNIYVTKEDIFNLSKHTGSKINGLIGVDIFEDYLVEINYTYKRINFYLSEGFKFPKGYQKLPITVESKKMYVQLSVLEHDTVHQNVKMLIDTGAELNAWFQTFTANAIHLPDKGVRGRIGQGLNGEVTGKFARIPKICFAEFCLDNPIVAFPDSADIADIILSSNRDGTIGSQLLSRFNIYLDYKNKFFYFKPNGSFKNPFTYNIAGIEIGQIIPFIPQTEVLYVWKNSPAEQAGILIGDQIIELNGIKTYQMQMSELKNYFETSSKHPLHITMIRDGKEIKLKIDMNSKL